MCPYPPTEVAWWKVWQVADVDPNINYEDVELQVWQYVTDKYSFQLPHVCMEHCGHLLKGICQGGCGSLPNLMLHLGLKAAKFTLHFAFFHSDCLTRHPEATHTPHIYTHNNLVWSALPPWSFACGFMPPVNSG
jgi:hypothetical protein